MNILVVSHCQNGTTPTSIFVHNQAVEYAKMGHKVMVLAGAPLYKRDFLGHRISSAKYKLRIDGIEYIFFRYISLSKYGVWGINIRNAINVVSRKLKDDITDFLPDIIHAHTIGFESEIGAWIKKVYRKPLVVTVHGSDVEVPIERDKTDLLNNWCTKADVIVTVSSKLKERLKKSGVNNNFETILNGYNKKNERTTEKIKHSIIQVGNLIKSKHYDITIKAFQLYHELYEDAGLTIIGQGEEKSRLEKMCADLGIERNVRFLNNLYNEEVLKKMGETEYFIMPSCPEGFGIVYLEAMSSRCVTIGTAGEGIADLIKDGENGFLVPVNNVDEIVKRLLWCESNPDKVEKIKEKAYLSVEYLDWNENARKYIQLFSSLIEKNEINEINL